jgi:hypothetical protein
VAGGAADRRRPIPAGALKAQILRELDRLEVVRDQLKSVEAERDALLNPASDEASSPAAMLVRLKGIGPETAAVLWLEGLLRRFNTRRQLAGRRDLTLANERGIGPALGPVPDRKRCLLRHAGEPRFERRYPFAEPCVSCLRGAPNQWRHRERATVCQKAITGWLRPFADW